MSTLAVTINTQLRVVETFTADEMTTLPASRRSFDNTDFDTRTALSATTTPAVTKWHGKEYEFAAGVVILDLQALANEIGDVVDMVGLELQAIMINNLSTTNTITLDSGVANGYVLTGGAAHDIVILPGSTWEHTFNNQLAQDVDGTHDTLHFIGTNGEDMEIAIVAG